MFNIPKKVIHVLSEPIVSINNGSEPTSSVILPCPLTKSLCGLAVMTFNAIQIRRRLDPPSRRLI